MTKGRNTRPVSVRVSYSVYTMIKNRADKRGVTMNDFLKWVIEHEVLRKR